MGTEIGELWLFAISGYQFIGKSQGHSSPVNIIFKNIFSY